MSQNTLASANTRFAVNLFKVIRKDLKGKNAFLSPLSISAALSMTQIGAVEKTAQEMAQVLGWESENGEQIHQQFQAYFTKLQQPSDVYQLSTANRIFVEKTFSVIEAFTNKTKEWYLAEPVQANFKKEADSETAKINAWVAEQTQNKIRDLFGPGVISDLTRMVLVNAIYFKGKWDKEFDGKSTSPRPFKLSPEQTKDVPTMYNKQVYGIYKDSELKFTAVELLYKGKELGMVIILPDEDFGLEDLVENLTPEKLDAVIKNVSLNKEKIQLYLPKFEITSTYKLREALISLGMVDAFSQEHANFSGITEQRDLVLSKVAHKAFVQITSTYMLKKALTSLGMANAFSQEHADFSGMTGQRDLVLSEVAHKAFVQVNEEGTEAAAATGVVMAFRCMPPPVPVVTVDHPFLFLISDHRADGSILFLGQITSTYMLKEALTSLGMMDAFSQEHANFSGMTGQRDLVLSEVAHKAFVQITSTYMLKKALTSLGMVNAFSQEHADFSGMTGQRDLVLSEVAHKAFVQITSTYMLKEALTSLGMADAFSQEHANFSGMTGEQDLVLSEVAHKAFVQVNEEGTEAAAATGAVMMMRCCIPPPVPVVTVDHPFLFLISDHRADGSILFLGQVDNPSS